MVVFVKVMKAGSHLLHGKKIDPKRLKERPTLSVLQKIFVGGVDPQMPESTIREYFGQFGVVSTLTSQLVNYLCTVCLSQKAVDFDNFYVQILNKFCMHDLQIFHLTCKYHYTIS